MDNSGTSFSLCYIRIKNGIAIRNGVQIAPAGNDAVAIYHALGCNYPKFFKMDSLCKWAWLGAEALLRTEGDHTLYDGFDKSGIAIMLTTTDGCLEVDKRYAETAAAIPSPALFVYTLPNIMLGEICIRHGFTGEQLCEVSDGFDSEELLAVVKDLLLARGATHCLFGKADAVNDDHDVCLFWADANGIEAATSELLQNIYHTYFC